MQINKESSVLRICLIVIMIMGLLTGCGSTSYRITPQKDYNDFDSDFDFLDSSTKQTISNLMKSVVDWYNSVEIPKDYSAVDLDVFTSITFSEYGEQLMQMNEEHDYRSGSDEGMRYLHATSPATAITGTIWGITSNNDVEVTVGADSSEKIKVSEDDWNNIKNKISDALDFYYGDGDRSAINSYTENTPVDEIESDNNSIKDSDGIDSKNDTTKDNTIILYRNDDFKEMDYSDEFIHLQRYLDYVGAAANNESLYLPTELNQNINTVEFKDHIGTFSYKIAGPSSGELFASERSAEFVRSGEWDSNDEIDTEQTFALIDVMDYVYGEHSVVFSDGEIIDKVSGEYDEYFNDDFFVLRWDDVQHYSYIYFLYSHNGTVTIKWSIYANVMLGFEPDIAVNMAVNKLRLKKDDIKRVSYVDISDLLTTDKDRELLSLKGYIVKFAFTNEEVLQKTGTQSIAMIIIFDGYSYESCYNDETVSSTTADAIYSKRSSKDFDLDKIQYEPVEGDFVKYEPVKQEKNSESSKQTEKKNKQDNTSSQVKNKCLVCGKTATHSMAGIASGELEWYCDEHWKFIQDTINNMEKDVGEGTASKHQCQASGCSKEGTNQIIGISGEYEYYCTEHYQEMVDLYNKMQNGSN